ncbi:MAG TPA: DUF420 domain-containing protein [Pyrinomonadaceae bacterium]|jgi:uncharacterized membrane protein YozB (DUF420 family)
MKYSLLPHINALLNATSALLLLAGFFFILRRRVRAHLTCMIGALAVSALFLVSYLFYHYNHGSTRFTGQGFIRPVYFVILISHTILAALIVPLIIVTVRRALRGDFGRHMRLARWTFPLWLYVSATGVVVYLMLYQLYPSR